VTRTPTPTRSPTPTPTSTTPFVTALHISPPIMNLDIGVIDNFTATADLSNATTQNYTQKVNWSSTSTSVATINNTAGAKGTVTAVSPGTTTITAVDPVSGVSSATSSSNGTVNVLGALASITVTPPTVTKVVGEFARFTATGHYVGGATKNITQQCTYSTSNSTIAVAPNDAGDKSRIDTVASGTVTVFATDPSTQIAGDATLTVRTPSATKTPTPTPTVTP
jgi:hypothetical protein